VGPVMDSVIAMHWTAYADSMRVFSNSNTNNKNCKRYSNVMESKK
jgi:hypothetical protein